MPPLRSGAPHAGHFPGSKYGLPYGSTAGFTRSSFASSVAPHPSTNTARLRLRSASGTSIASATSGPPDTIRRNAARCRPAGPSREPPDTTGRQGAAPRPRTSGARCGVGAQGARHSSRWSGEVSKIVRIRSISVAIATIRSVNGSPGLYASGISVMYRLISADASLNTSDIMIGPHSPWCRVVAGRVSAPLRHDCGSPRNRNRFHLRDAARPVLRRRRTSRHARSRRYGPRRLPC